MAGWQLSLKRKLQGLVMLLFRVKFSGYGASVVLKLSLYALSVVGPFKIYCFV